jgi:hypothetical protein
MKEQSNTSEAPASPNQTSALRKKESEAPRRQSFASEALVLIHNSRLEARAIVGARELLPHVRHLQQPQPTEQLNYHPTVFIHTEKDEIFNGHTCREESSQPTVTPLYTSVLRITRDGRLATYQRVEDHQLVETTIKAPLGYIWTEDGALKRETDGECYHPTIEQLEAVPPDLGERVTAEIDSRIWVRARHLPQIFTKP